MPSQTRTGGFEIDQSLRFQRREWVFERFGWLFLVAFVAAACLGLVGPGALSKTTKQHNDWSLRVRYERHVHRFAPTTLVVRVPESAASADEIALSLNRDYFERVELKQIVPAPVRIQAGLEHYTFVFKVGERGGPVTILFHLEPETPGSLSGEFSVGNEQAVRFDQFVYP